MSIVKQIENKLKHKKKGQLIFISDFANLGNYDTVRKAMQRLAEKTIILRISQGIYYYPQKDNELGILYPSIEMIAKAVADRDRAHIIPSGEYAMYLLNLSEQVPMNVVFLTDGSTREIKINNRRIVFRKTTPKNLQIKNKLLILITQALKVIGKENLSRDQIEIIKSHLSKETNLNEIKKEVYLIPVWIRKIILNIINEIKYELA